ncbi:hypothetical protein DN068_14935 [Taibaiella soli]|uniref:Uncharacterized protein n=2 Tax=Taibaiella soli TaxID=1649169 RepID=A0A2W2BFP3_9BACT|nr:hypothetical protein DN068_14935 [Taibaiella soli]
MARKITGTFALVIAALPVFAQERKLMKEGNNLYEQKKYKEAAAVYQQALQKNPAYTPGLFNLGNAQYQAKQLDAARNTLTTTAKSTSNPLEKSGAQYNIGNTYMDEKKWQDAIDAYKQALRNNPQDADAKYNLSYATAMKKKEDENNKDKKKDQKDKNKDQQNKDQKNKDKKDQNKDQQNKDQQNKDQQNKDQQNKDQQDKDQQDQHPQPKPGNLSQKQADQILNALQQEEKNLQDKMQKTKGVPVKVDKDW